MAKQVKKEIKEIKWPSSETGGVMPMSIASRFYDERHRLSEDFNEKWRKYRIKYLESLALERKDPREVEALYLEITNPIRRLYQTPMNKFEKVALTPIFGKHYARQTRNGIAIFFGMYAVGLWVYHALNYGKNTNNWENKGTIKSIASRPVVLPGDPAYPLQNPKPYDWQFADDGFSKRKSHLNI